MNLSVGHKYDFTGIQDSEKLIEPDENGGFKMSVLTRQILNLTLWVGIPNITEATAQEFYERIQVFQDNGDAFLIVEDEDKVCRPYLITLQDVRRYIGLTTNAAPMSREQFLNHYKEINR